MLEKDGLSNANPAELQVASEHFSRIVAVLQTERELQ